jgi:hypothetical protein
VICKPIHNVSHANRVAAGKNKRNSCNHASTGYPTHLVETNMSDQPRHSITLNTFVKGQLGDYRAVTELKL